MSISIWSLPAKEHRFGLARALRVAPRAVSSDLRCRCSRRLRWHFHSSSLFAHRVDPRVCGVVHEPGPVVAGVGTRRGRRREIAPSRGDCGRGRPRFRPRWLPPPRRIKRLVHRVTGIRDVSTRPSPRHGSRGWSLRLLGCARTGPDASERRELAAPRGVLGSCTRPPGCQRGAVGGASPLASLSDLEGLQSLALVRVLKVGGRRGCELRVVGWLAA
jgi:hypothetical protein